MGENGRDKGGKKERVKGGISERVKNGKTRREGKWLEVGKRGRIKDGKRKNGYMRKKG